MRSITIDKDSLSINKLKEALKEISISVYEDGEGGLVFKRQKLKPKVCVSYEQMQALFKPFFDKIKCTPEELRLTDPDPIVRTFKGDELEDILRSKIKNGTLCYSDFLKYIDPKFIPS